MAIDKNPMEGKRVRLILCEEDSENADGIRGHLVEVPVSETNPVHHKGFYEICVKRFIDILLSIQKGTVLLSVPLACLIISVCFQSVWLSLR